MKIFSFYFQVKVSIENHFYNPLGNKNNIQNRKGENK